MNLGDHHANLLLPAQPAGLSWSLFLSHGSQSRFHCKRRVKGREKTRIKPRKEKA